MILMPAIVIGWRVAYERLSRIGPFKERIVVVGTGALARRVVKEVLDHHATEYDILGFVEQDTARVGESVVNPRVIGDVDLLETLARRQRVDKVIVALPDRRGKLPVTELLQCKYYGTQVDDGVNFYEQLVGKILVESLRPSWFIFSSGFKQPKAVLLAKRALDIIGALALLAATFPLFLLVAPVIRLESPGPAFFRQKRVGERGRVFTLLKFRSMNLNAETETGPVWAQKNDPRVTRLGRFMRKTRIDELPQLINVLRGDMSFVGPRPERPYFVSKLKRQIPFYALRHSLKPGITGWAQIRYPYGATVEDALEKLQYDLFYIKHLSLWLDVMIVLETIKVVLIGRGAR
jgi:sugar transferase (PEP-CTERM system associated)